MEVVVPMSTSPNFHFESVVASPYATAPSSPRLFGEPFDHHYHYTSAPTSPTRATAMFSQWSGEAGGGDLFDFAFDSGRQSGSLQLPEISTADELFEKGRIRLLQPPPTAAAVASPRGGERGRQRGVPASVSGSGNRPRESRSLSPLRTPEFFPKADASTAGAKGAGGTKKWRLKDLLLFRSASEGRATGRTGKDPLQKYTILPSFSSFTTSSTSKKKGGEDPRSGSFRSTGSDGKPAKRAGLGAASPHEMHYTANRAAAEGQRKKTPLPYQRHGLFGCLQFNPAIRSITKGFTGEYSFSRGRP